MQNDPYKILGVPRDASAEDIKAAYREQSKKAHPDHGGSSDKFTRVKQASLVLLDPEKRKRFDQDGTLDDNKPDNLTATAMERVASFFINSINATIDKPEIRLDQLDLVQGARAFFDQNIHECYKQINGVERQIKQFEKAAKRLKTKRSNDVIKGMLNAHISALRAHISGNNDQITILKKAQEILKDYEFEQETKPAPSTPSVDELRARFLRNRGILGDFR